MNLSEYLLTKLGEEANEVGQRTSKAQCFGLDEKQEGQDLTNAERLNYELNDLFATLDILHEYGIFKFRADLDAQARKKKKILKYMIYSRDVCGTLEDWEKGWLVR